MIALDLRGRNSLKIQNFRLIRGNLIQGKSELPPSDLGQSIQCNSGQWELKTNSGILDAIVRHLKQSALAYLGQSHSGNSESGPPESGQFGKMGIGTNWGNRNLSNLGKWKLGQFGANGNLGGH